MAAIESRGDGSASTCRAPSSGSWAATAARVPGPGDHEDALGPSGAAGRRCPAAACGPVPVRSSRNLGCPARDRGQSRVPAPPAGMTAWKPGMAGGHGGQGSQARPHGCPACGVPHTGPPRVASRSELVHYSEVRLGTTVVRTSDSPGGSPSVRSARRAVKRKAPAGTLYRGREGMWSWVAHRVTGVAIFFFLLVHVLDTSLVRISPEDYNDVIGTYKNPIMGLGEAGLVAAIVFHAFNGIRIILVDFWAKGPKYQRADALDRDRPVRRDDGRVPAPPPDARVRGRVMSTIADPKAPRAPARPPVPPDHPRQHRAVRLGVHARVRRDPAGADLRPPLRQPLAGPGRQGDRLRLRRRQVGVARSGRSGTC